MASFRRAASSNERPRSRLHVAIGSALQTVVRLTVLLGSAVAVAIQVRTLTVAEYGVFATILSVITLVTGFTDIGLTSTAVQRMSRTPDKQSAIAGGLLMARGALGLFLGVIGAGVSTVLFSTASDRFAAALMIASVPIGMLTALQAVPMARLQLMQQNILLATQGLLWLVVVIVLGWQRAGLILFAGGYLLCAVIQALLIWMILGRRNYLDVKRGAREIAPLLRQAVPLGVGGMGVTAYYRLSGIILFAASGPIAAASFSAAFKVVDMLQAVPASLLAPLIPLLAHAFEVNDRVRVSRIWDLASRVTLSAAAMTAAGVYITAPQIVAVLYGPAYVDSVPLLRVVVFAFVPICLGWVTTGALTATGRVRGYAVVTISVAVLSVSCAVLLTPRFGAEGAAGIMLATETLVAAGLLWVLRRQTRLCIRFATWMRTLLAAGVMASVVYLVNPPVSEIVLLAIRVPIGLVVAAMSLLVFRVIALADVKAVLSRADIAKSGA